MCNATKLSAKNLTEEITNLKIVFSNNTNKKVKNILEENENIKESDIGEKIEGENFDVNLVEEKVVKIPPRITINVHKNSKSRTVSTKGKEKEEKEKEENEDDDDIKCYTKHSDILFAFSPILVKVKNILNSI